VDNRAPNGIKFEAPRSIKAHALADFFAKNAIVGPQPFPCDDVWSLYVDGFSTKDGSGANLIIETPHGGKHEHALKFMFKASNNEAKYKALIAGIELCYTAEAKHIRIPN